MCNYELYFDLSTSIIELGASIIILIGAAIGLCTVNKLKKKQLNAAFNFFSRLKVKVKILSDIFSNEDYKEFLMERMVPELQRTKDKDMDSGSSIIPIIIGKLSNVASKTIKFLMKESDQMPASSDGWNKKISLLVEFLEDCELMRNDHYFKWAERDEEKEKKYYSAHTDNLKSIISTIEERQNEIAKKICKK